MRSLAAGLLLMVGCAPVTPELQPSCKLVVDAQVKLALVDLLATESISISHNNEEEICFDPQDAHAVEMAMWHVYRVLYPLGQVTISDPKVAREFVKALEARMIGHSVRKTSNQTLVAIATHDLGRAKEILGTLTQ